jgi:hypothetical protein
VFGFIVVKSGITVVKKRNPSSHPANTRPPTAMAMGPAKQEINPYPRSDFGRAVPFIAVRFMSWGAKAAVQSNGSLVEAQA